MKSYYLLLLLAGLGVVACQNSTSTDKGKLFYTTSADSTLRYYQEGWHEIMDLGFYGPAEQSYRKALEFDPDFLIGKSVLARLTLDLEERLALYEELQANKDQITGDERLVLDVYIALTHFTNIREQAPERAPEVLQEVLALAEKNFRKIAHRYPGEIYLKSEYIEILNSRWGPKAALDSLAVLTTPEQKDHPFLLGFAASMEAELGQFESALEKADRLERIIDDSDIPKPHVVYADIYFQMDSLAKAKKYADRAYELDARNLDASRLRKRINERLELE